MKRKCSKCNIVKDIDNFYKRSDNKKKFNFKCKGCIKIDTDKFYKNNPTRLKEIRHKTYIKNIDKRKKDTANWRIKNPEGDKNLRLKRIYGINITEYNNILEKQNKVCAICNKSNNQKNRALHVDHCHKTGKVRGLLCHACNSGLGSLKEDINILKKAIIYLEEAMIF